MEDQPPDNGKALRHIYNLAAFAFTYQHGWGLLAWQRPHPYLFHLR